MGYARYIDAAGREAGYAVQAVCDHEGCDTEIDRGVSYRCPDCAEFFCFDHLTHVAGADESLCPVCCDGEEPIRALAATIFDPEDVEVWLDTTDPDLDGERPLALIDRGEGERVRHLLEALADGVVL